MLNIDSRRSGRLLIKAILPAGRSRNESFAQNGIMDDDWTVMVKRLFSELYHYAMKSRSTMSNG